MQVSATRQSLAESQLLAALSPADQEHLLPDLGLNTFALGDTIYESGEPLDYVYFPTSCIVSLVYTMESGVCNAPQSLPSAFSR